HPRIDCGIVESLDDSVGVVARDRERHDAAAIRSLVSNAHTVDAAESLAQLIAEGAHAAGDRRDSEFRRVSHRRAEPENTGDRTLPLLEAPGVVTHLVLARACPLGPSQI